MPDPGERYDKDHHAYSYKYAQSVEGCLLRSAGKVGSDESLIGASSKVFKQQDYNEWRFNLNFTPTNPIINGAAHNTVAAGASPTIESNKSSLLCSLPSTSRGAMLGMHSAIDFPHPLNVDSRETKLADDVCHPSC